MIVVVIEAVEVDIVLDIAGLDLGAPVLLPSLLQPESLAPFLLPNTPSKPCKFQALAPTMRLTRTN